MTIRSRIRTAMTGKPTPRSSLSNSSQPTDDSSNRETSPVFDDPASTMPPATKDVPSRPTSRLGRVLTWRSDRADKKDPREKPLTKTNLEHQEMLGNFSMTFGTRRISQIARTSFGGVSPGTSRQASVDQGGLAASKANGGGADGGNASKES